MDRLRFRQSQPLTIGVELELQLVNTRDYDLTRGASDLLGALANSGHPGDIKPEITESMIEMSSSVHANHAGLLAELRGMREALVAAAQKLNLGIAGGGGHPFQKWSDRRIYDTERFNRLAGLYGYLAKQFTVFGQHIHVGCADGDEAVYLTHMLSRYVPHFIALSASSPFHQGEDTLFDSSRLSVINAFPLSGTMPLVRGWEEFEGYFARMRDFGAVKSMKDFYWDIRPKPEYGTTEIRVCDTPLSVERAAALAAYAQSLARYLRLERPRQISADLYLVYNLNRFQACRYGLDANLIDPLDGTRLPLRQDLGEIYSRIAPHAEELGCRAAVQGLLLGAQDSPNDARRLRTRLAESGSLADVVHWQCEQWMRAAA
ncbi:MAG: YbdK family carboxylate-amine ligase [Burkholderiales bacterium]